jgi:DNA-directed RNA polymerase III subunit RPC7
MSRGGGRGGGRGGRGGRGSMTQDLIRDNMEDLGLDSYQVIDDRIPPPLYPEIQIPGPNPLTEEDSFKVQKMRKIAHRLQTSPYYLTRKVEENDIKRHADRHRKANSDLSLFQCINTSSIDASRYVPSELLDGRPLGGRQAGGMNGEDMDSVSKRESQKRRREKDALQKLENAEGSGKPGEKKEGEKKEGDEGEDDGLDLEENPDEFEMDDDYGVDHYASDDGGGGGDDDGDEAVY